MRLCEIPLKRLTCVQPSAIIIPDEGEESLDDCPSDEGDGALADTSDKQKEAAACLIFPNGFNTYRREASALILERRVTFLQEVPEDLKQRFFEDLAAKQKEEEYIGFELM